MLELNRIELRALVVSTGLLALGAAARLGLGPGPARYAWVPDPDGISADVATPRAVLGAVREGLLREERASRPLRPGETIEPNTAPVEELRRLPGIGPTRARAIVEGRRQGPYRSPADLARVPGLGPATVARLKPHLPAPAARSFTDESSGGRVNVNRAQITELEQITGIGPVLARRIVETRARLGGFRTIEDLLEVPGIGPQTLHNIRPQIHLR